MRQRPQLGPRQSAVSILLSHVDIDRTEHGGEQHPRSEFRREQLQIEPERAEAGLDRRMRQRQEGRHVPVRIAVIAPRVDMRRRHDDRRIAVVFEPVDELERGFLETRERQLVVIILVTIVPGGDAGGAAAHALGQHDHAACVQIGDVGRTPWIARVGRIKLQRRAVGDADEVGAERTGFRLDLSRGERLFEHRDHF